jgi:hypothetical protein
MSTLVMMKTEGTLRSRSSVVYAGPEELGGLRKARGRSSLYSDADLSTRLKEKAALWFCLRASITSMTD